MSRYITLGIALVIFTVIGGLTFLVKRLDTKNDQLTAQLAQVNLQNSIQTNIINQYSSDREYMNQLLTDRALRSAQQEKELNEQITKLKKSLNGIKCSIPQSVTDELRSTY